MFGSKTSIAAAVLGLVISLTGLFMLFGGIYLIALDGSWYFAPAGLGLSIAGILIAMRRPAGAILYLLVFLATVIWALWDVGLAFWPLVSRVFAPAVLAVPVLLLAPVWGGEQKNMARGPAFALAAVMVLTLIATVIGAFQPRQMVAANSARLPVAGRAVAALPGGNWPYWGRTPSGTRFAPFGQITPANVADLKVAWVYRTGDIPKDPAAFVTVPLHVDGKLYGCTQTSQVFAIDADTGKEIWRYNPHAQGAFRPRCRGVSFYDQSQIAGTATPTVPMGAKPTCMRRIIATTVDARLVALDAQTGLPCQGFGENGVVDLHAGMGKVTPGFYIPTAAPTVVRNVIIVGGLVRDNHDTDEPSGVVRAFDARTGKLVWAWDMGNPDWTPDKNQPFTRGTPNVWSTPAFDDGLGLIYLPTGNATPDFWGGRRSAAAERYSSSIIALDVDTGKVRWNFQTTHHDLWDYDVPSQPALYDVPDGHGGTIPAVIQATKRGQLFMLDRRTGIPIAKVEERPVTRKGVVGDDHLSPTQPYSVGMPALGTDRLTESRMWGATLLDQLVCRIEFRQARYDGDFTPPGLTPGIQYPSWLGGVNWGSVSIAENRGYLIVNDTRVPVTNQLVPRATYDATHHGAAGEGAGAPQYGTPYGLKQAQFLSPLGVPCQAPPYGAITAINLATRKVAWSEPLGTLQDTGPFGLAMHLPIPIGLPAIGGPITTASGLVFMAGTQDHYIRALDVMTGRELWKGRLPLGAETTPITYVSPHSGRQFVVISAGGNLAQTGRGDYVVAFALPK